jgi:hypothetical protein
MPFRIDTVEKTEGVVLAFHGLLDAAALLELLVRMAAATRPVHVVLKVGTEVDPMCLSGLRRLGASSVSAESPFLGRWLAEDPS